MSVEHIELLVEEPSMEAALQALLPGIVGEISFRIIRFQCKQDLLARLPERLRGYRGYFPPNWRIVVLVDRDDDDCRALKAALERMAGDAGLCTKSCAAGGTFAIVNRLAIEELESWYFGDWEAVRRAYPRVSDRIPAKASYRDPDSIAGGTWEAFERILQRAGYFAGGLRKIEAARAIASQMDPARNRSRSFQVFFETIRGMT